MNSFKIESMGYYLRDKKTGDTIPLQHFLTVARKQTKYVSDYKVTITYNGITKTFEPNEVITLPRKTKENHGR